MKKTIALIAALVMFISLSGMAFAAELQGKVTKVDGKLVTIQITKGKAADLAVDSKVKLETEDGKPKKKGGSALQGC